MAIPQQKFRELVFQMLYGYDIGKAKDDELIHLLMKELATTKKTAYEAKERVTKIAAILPELDEMINATSKSYDFKRIQTVERNILRLGLFEIFFDDQIPVKVAIAEAIRLARKFSTPESSSFINAILDTLYKVSQGKQIDSTEILRVSEELEKSEEAAKNAIKEQNPQKNEEIS